MKNPLAEIFGSLADGIGNAIRDVREKVLEEPWYGRATSPHENAPNTLQDLRDLYGVQPAQTEPAAPEIAIGKDAPQPSVHEELAATYSKTPEVKAPDPAPEIEQTQEQEIER